MRAPICRTIRRPDGRCWARGAQGPRWSPRRRRRRTGDAHTVARDRDPQRPALAESCATCRSCHRGARTSRPEDALRRTVTGSSSMPTWGRSPQHVVDAGRRTGAVTSTISGPARVMAARSGTNAATAASSASSSTRKCSSARRPATRARRRGQCGRRALGRREVHLEERAPGVTPSVPIGWRTPWLGGTHPAVLTQHMRCGQRGMPAQRHLGARREPPKGERRAAPLDERRLGEPELGGEGLHPVVVGGRLEQAHRRGFPVKAIAEGVHQTRFSLMPGDRAEVAEAASASSSTAPACRRRSAPASRPGRGARRRPSSDGHHPAAFREPRQKVTASSPLAAMSWWRNRWPRADRGSTRPSSPSQSWSRRAASSVRRGSMYSDPASRATAMASWKGAGSRR